MQYRKAIIAAIASGITVAALYYDWPPLIIAAAVIEPFLVYLIPNRKPLDTSARVKEYAP